MKSLTTSAGLLELIYSSDISSRKLLNMTELSLPAARSFKYLSKRSWKAPFNASKMLFDIWILVDMFHIEGFKFDQGF